MAARAPLEFDSAPDIAWINGDLPRIEAKLFQATPDDIAGVESLVPVIRDSGDAALLGRALSVLSRAQIVAGKHASAIGTAQAALAAFDQLGWQELRFLAGPRAEAARASGVALLKLGHFAQALPRIEAAVEIAQAAVDTADARDDSGISALSALVRALTTLSIALVGTREIDTGITLYYRTTAVIDAHPRVYEEFPDDAILVLWNLTEALHKRARRRRAGGDASGAQDDLDAAAGVLETAARRVVSASLAPYGREGYYGSMARQLLLTDRPAEALDMFRRQLDEVAREGVIDKATIAMVQTGLAEATLALGRPAEALAHSTSALRALDEHDQVTERAEVLLLRSHAFRALDRHAQAYEALEEHHAVRSAIDAVAANEYAALMTARLGLERAHADAESHRRIAAMLETLGRVGQEITANLDPGRVCRILAQHMSALLLCQSCVVWLVDTTGSRLSRCCGVDDGCDIEPATIAIDDPLSTPARVARDRMEICGDASAPHALFASLTVADRILGVVSIWRAPGTEYTENERSTFRTLCTYGAIALDNAAAYTKLERTVETLQATQTELAVRTAEFERLSMTDPLTGLGNRRHLHERAAIEIAERWRKSGQLAVAMFDIDHFKRVNDTHGHAVGDAVLQAVAQVAKDWLRPADFIARFGGEEFALLLPGAGIREAVVIAERIRASIAETPICAGEAKVWVTSSFGVSAFTTADETLDAALKRADAALYAAKESGRNRVTCST